MKMNKKVVSKITTMVIVLAVIALVIAKLYDIAIHRPSLAYRQLSPEMIYWLKMFNETDPQSLIKAAPVGPFDWSNKKDFGQKNKKKWRKEEDDKSIVYFPTREVKYQIQAQNVQQNVDNIIRELPDFFGSYKGPESMNGRKLAIYVPSTKGKYDTLQHVLSDEVPAGGSKYGRSFISIGPLGCQNKGIIIHPDAFVAITSDGDPQYIRVLRRELAYYTYLSNVDYNIPAQRYSWFIQGVAVYFSMDGKRLPAFPPELIQRIEEECSLDAEFPAKDNLNQVAGTSFIQFYDRSFGRRELVNLIEATYTMPVDSALCRNDRDLVTLKQMWIESLRAELVPEQNQTTY